jgi:hypothetical protein
MLNAWLTIFFEKAMLLNEGNPLPIQERSSREFLLNGRNGLEIVFC